MAGTNDGNAADETAGDVTLQSYESAAEQYVAESQEPRGRVLDFLDAFARLVGSGTVLELGSGPGWDADHVERRGLRVVRTDGAASLVTRLREQGHDAWMLDVRTDDFGGPYDGLLANAVLLHLSRDELVEVLRRARRALRPGGVLAFTLKEGDSEAWSHAKLDLPRHFTYWRESGVRRVLSATGWQVLSLERVRGRREDWLYVLVRPG